MSKLNIHQLDAHLNVLVSSFKGALPDAGIETLVELLSVREYKVAFEILCDLLAEQDLRIPKDSFDRLVTIGQSLGADPSYWRGIVTAVP